MSGLGATQRLVLNALANTANLGETVPTTAQVSAAVDRSGGRWWLTDEAVGACLRRLEKRGLVRRVNRNPVRWWLA